MFSLMWLSLCLVLLLGNEIFWYHCGCWLWALVCCEHSLDFVDFIAVAALIMPCVGSWQWDLPVLLSIWCLRDCWFLFVVGACVSWNQSCSWFRRRRLLLLWRLFYDSIWYLMTFPLWHHLLVVNYSPDVFQFWKIVHSVYKPDSYWGLWETQYLLTTWKIPYAYRAQTLLVFSK